MATIFDFRLPVTFGSIPVGTIGVAVVEKWGVVILLLSHLKADQDMPGRSVNSHGSITRE